MTVAAVGVTTLQFSGTDATASNLRRLVQDLVNVEKALNNLISLENATTSPSDTVPPHVLATTSGLDADHTVTGLTAGQVLKAISATNAAFAKLKFSEMQLSDVSDNPENGDFMQFVDGFWVASPAPPGGSSGLNIGGGAGIYASNVGAVLQFKTLMTIAGLFLVPSGSSITIAPDPVPLTAALKLFTTLLQGLVPPPGAVNGFFLRDDGTWAQVIQLAIPPIGAGWATSDGVTALTLPIGAITRLMSGAYTIKAVEILTQGGTGSCVVDIWKANRTSHYPPGSGDDITGGVPPAIVAGMTYFNNTLAGWTTAIAAEDVFLFTLASTTGFTNVTISIEIG